MKCYCSRCLSRAGRFTTESGGWDTPYYEPEPGEVCVERERLRREAHTVNPTLCGPECGCQPSSTH